MKPLLAAGPAARLASITSAALVAIAVAACGTGSAPPFAFPATRGTSSAASTASSSAAVAGSSTAAPTSTSSSAPSAKSTPAATPTEMPRSTAAPKGTAEPTGSAAGTARQGTTATNTRATPLRVASAVAPAAASVRIVDYAFSAARITIGAGGTVTWTNTGSDRHSVAFGRDESSRLASGDTFRKTFATAGRFADRCGIHPSMTGVVVVTAARTGNTTRPSSSGAATATATAPPTTRPAPTGTTSPTATADDHGNDVTDGAHEDGQDDAAEDANDDHGGGRNRGSDRTNDDRSGSNSGAG